MRRNILFHWLRGDSGDRVDRDPPMLEGSMESTLSSDSNPKQTNPSEEELASSIREEPEALVKDDASYTYPGRPAERKKMDANLYRALSG